MLNVQYPEYERHRELRTLIAQKNVARIWYFEIMNVVFFTVSRGRIADVHYNLARAREWFKIWKDKEQQLGLRTEYVGE
jgi:hypothetical protein